MDFQELHRQLLDPATYPEATKSVTFRETHISRVYLTDTHAYKLKKPLDLGFLDFSTLKRRAFFCAEEVRLNRRYSPDTYLGVAELRLRDGVAHFGTTGDLVDFAVRMRRLPEERMLDFLLDRKDPGLAYEIARLARHVPSLLAASESCPAEEAANHAELVRAICTENLDQMLVAVGHSLSSRAHRILAEISAVQLQALTPLLQRRARRGWIRDGHGDLHARNICMTDPIQVYDCIEFSRRFRTADCAAELAFLLMDLDFRERRDLTRLFLVSLPDEIADADFLELLPFFKSYRASVRGKVEALLGTEAEVAPQERHSALARSRRYFNLALGYHAPPMLLLTTGLMGVGKSTIAQALGAALSAELLRSDVIRKELAGLSADRQRPDPFGKGLYSPAMTARTYAEMHERCAALLEQGRTVIVDAAFTRADQRRTFLELADRLEKPARTLFVQADLATVRARLDRRFATGEDVSDGRSELLAAQAEVFERPAPGPLLIEIDTSTAVDYNIQEVLCQLLDQVSVR